MLPESLAERRRGAVVVGDQRWTAAAAERAPVPGDVRDAALIGPFHVPVDEAVAAVVLADLAAHDGVALRDGSDRTVPAPDVDAFGEVVDVHAGDELSARVIRQIAGPCR